MKYSHTGRKLNLPIVLLLLISSCLICVSGCKTSPATNEIKEIRVWWGNKEEIKIFLDSPQAKAKRWLVEALGE